MAQKVMVLLFLVLFASAVYAAHTAVAESVFKFRGGEKSVAAPGQASAGTLSPLSAADDEGGVNGGSGINIHNGASSSAGYADGGKRALMPRLFSLRFVEFFFRRCLSLVIKDVDALRIAARVLHYTFWVMVSLSAAGTLGLDTKPMLSLLSVALVTLGFASKDVLVTALDGALLLIARPFSRGQMVSVTLGGQAHRGVVQEISFKYVKLLNDKKQQVLLPVSLVYNSPIVVESPRPK